MRCSIVRVLLVPILLLCGAASLQAQKEYNVWYFGDSAGVTFNTPTPSALTDGRMYAVEGCASIADHTTGQLLFYTDGITVLDRTHRPMPNGTNLAGGPSTAQAAHIVPDPIDSSIYYLFSLDDISLIGLSTNRGLAYSVVDMRLNGGLGDVTQKNVLLARGTTEQMTAIRHCNGRDVWLIAHLVKRDVFLAFLVSPAGVSIAAVSSSTGPIHPDNNGGMMVGSPDGTMLGMVYGLTGQVVLFQFVQ